MNKKHNKASEPLISGRIIVGVTGHRLFKDEPLIRKKVQDILEQIKQDWLNSHNTRVVFTVLTPLAEGADRLVAQEVLKNKDAQLEVVLPLAVDDYMNDFEAPESKNEFKEFLARAESIKELPPAKSRNESYEQVGHYIVDNCDVLIALWDGNPAAGQGGTAEIVAYAHAQKRICYWIPIEKR